MSCLAAIWSARALSADVISGSSATMSLLAELAVLGASEGEEALQQPVGVVEIHAQLGV